jgi:hypothetical protein
LVKNFGINRIGCSPENWFLKTRKVEEIYGPVENAGEFLGQFRFQIPVDLLSRKDPEKFN